MKLIPNFTQVPNIFFDEMLSKLGYAEVKCLCYIFRRTYGFQKQSDKISLTQFESGITGNNGNILDRGTGLKRKNIVSALNKLSKLGVVRINKNGSINSYSLVLDYDSKLDTQSNHTSYVKYPELVTQSNIQKKEKESIQKKDNASKLADPMSLDIFIDKCKQSNMKHIQIIGEWAEGEKPRHTTYGEWQSFIKRNLRVAKELSAYPIEKIEKAYQLLQNDVIRKLPNGKTAGFITKYSLETVIKYIDKV